MLKMPIEIWSFDQKSGETWNLKELMLTMTLR